MCASGAKDKNGNKGQDTVAVNEANFKGSSEASLKRFTDASFQQLRKVWLSEGKREGGGGRGEGGANALTQRR